MPIEMNEEQFAEMKEKRFEKIVDLFIKAYAVLIRKGFRKRNGAMENRVSKLPEIEQSVIRSMTEIRTPLKDALADRYHQRGKGHHERFVSR